jgi:integrase/predicted RNA-binding Zn-ribbon protein involved in translation (DUF1610 family)
MQTAAPLACPSCGGTKLYRDGIRYLADGSQVQRWLCRACGFRFSESSLNNCQTKKEGGAHGKKALAVEAEKEMEKREAGATEQAADVKGALVQFMWWLKKQGYSDATVKTRVKFLKCFAKNNVDIYNPEAVKEFICRMDRWSVGYKELAVESYSSFLTMIGKPWSPPRYRRVPKLPFIPQETELEQLTACFNTGMAALLLLLKETGVRIGEAVRLEWRDIDFEAGTIRITPEKGSEPRIFRLSGRLLSMLKRLQEKAGSTRVFPSKSCVEAYFYRKRKQIAAKLCNPRLLQISFHTFRHWKATMEYAKTKDILHVMKLLGHRNIQNTLVYTQLVNFESDEYICKAARSLRKPHNWLKAASNMSAQHLKELCCFRKRK